MSVISAVPRFRSDYHLLGEPSGNHFGRIIRAVENRRNSGARNFEDLSGCVRDAKCFGVGNKSHKGNKGWPRQWSRRGTRR